MDLHDLGRGIGTMIAVGILSPALYLGSEYLSNCAESLIRKAVRRWGSKKPGAQERLLKNLARFRVIRK